MIDVDGSRGLGALSAERLGRAHKLQWLPGKTYSIGARTSPSPMVSFEESPKGFLPKTRTRIFILFLSQQEKWISGDSRQLGSDSSVLYLRGFFEFTSKKARLGLDRGDCSMAFSRGLQPASWCFMLPRERQVVPGCQMTTWLACIWPCRLVFGVGDFSRAFFSFWFPLKTNQSG